MRVVHFVILVLSYPFGSRRPVYDINGVPLSAIRQSCKNSTLRSGHRVASQLISQALETCPSDYELSMIEKKFADYGQLVNVSLSDAGDNRGQRSNRRGRKFMPQVIAYECSLLGVAYAMLDWIRIAFGMPSFRDTIDTETKGEEIEEIDLADTIWDQLITCWEESTENTKGKPVDRFVVVMATSDSETMDGIVRGGGEGRHIWNVLDILEESRKGPEEELVDDSKTFLCKASSARRTGMFGGGGGEGWVVRGWGMGYGWAMGYEDGG